MQAIRARNFSKVLSFKAANWLIDVQNRTKFGVLPNFNRVFPPVAPMSMPVYQPITGFEGSLPSISPVASGFPFDLNGMMPSTISLGQLVNQVPSQSQLQQKTSIASFLALQAQLLQKAPSLFNLQGLQNPFGFQQGENQLNPSKLNDALSSVDSFRSQNQGNSGVPVTIEGGSRSFDQVNTNS